MFRNDGSDAKLGYHLARSARLSTLSRAGRTAAGSCWLRVTLGSTAPPGGTVVDARLDDNDAAEGTGTEQSRTVGIVTVDLPPGASRALEVTLPSGELPQEDSIPAERV